MNLRDEVVVFFRTVYSTSLHWYLVCVLCCAVCAMNVSCVVAYVGGVSAWCGVAVVSSCRFRVCVCVYVSTVFANCVGSVCGVGARVMHQLNS
jgi:hypothetical protein